MSNLNKILKSMTKVIKDHEDDCIKEEFSYPLYEYLHNNHIDKKAMNTLIKICDELILNTGYVKNAEIINLFNNVKAIVYELNVKDAATKNIKKIMIDSLYHANEQCVIEYFLDHATDKDKKNAKINNVKDVFSLSDKAVFFTNMNNHLNFSEYLICRAIISIYYNFGETPVSYDKTFNLLISLIGEMIKATENDHECNIDNHLTCVGFSTLVENSLEDFIVKLNLESI